MATLTERIQPFRSTDGRYEPLAALVMDAAMCLNPGFAAGTHWHEESRVSQPEVSDEVTRVLGGPTQGLRVMHRKGYAPGTGAQTVDRIVVSAFGLGEGLGLVLECTRSWYDPRYVELRVTGPDRGALSRAAALFRERFDSGNVLTPQDVPAVLSNARAAVSAGEWRAAEMFADAILAMAPQDADALFYMGVARGAQGDLDTAEALLLQTTELLPDHYDAWYNLGAIYARQDRLENAADAFQESLAARPDNHPVFYHLGCVLEALGHTVEAIAAYRDAVRTSPNPHDYWGYRGMDHTKQAKEAIARLGGDNGHAG